MGFDDVLNEADKLRAQQQQNRQKEEAAATKRVTEFAEIVKGSIVGAIMGLEEPALGRPTGAVRDSMVNSIALPFARRVEVTSSGARLTLTVTGVVEGSMTAAPVTCSNLNFSLRRNDVSPPRTQSIDVTPTDQQAWSTPVQQQFYSLNPHKVREVLRRLLDAVK